MNGENDKIQQVINKVNENIMVIENNLYTLTNIFEYRSIKKILFYLDSVIPFSKKFLSNTQTFFINNIRFLHLFLNELIGYILEFCSPLHYDSTFNKMDTELIVIPTIILKLLNSTIRNSQQLQYVEYKLLNFQYLNSPYFDKFSF